MKMIGSLTTESINNKWCDLDCLDTSKIVEIMLQEDAHMVESVSREKKVISFAIEKISERYRKGGRIIYVGAGTSGRMGVMDAAECPPTFGVSADSIKGIIAGGYGAMTTAVERIEDSVQQGAQDIAGLHLGEWDTVVAISASGRTPYCVGAIREARRSSALTVAICGNKESEMGTEAECAIEVVTGPEVIAGSTRLKAASAQKAILNMISSIVMIQAGKVYKNLMVDLVASNEKLLDRSIRIFQAATNVTEREWAKNRIQEADGNLKTAIVMEECMVSKQLANQLLKRANGYVRVAIMLGK